MSGLSLYQQHRQRWGNGCGAGECNESKHVCLARGKVPCDVLFVGEAPGDSEDVSGAPFVGPAGQLLDHCIEQAWAGAYRCAFTNAVGCLPRDEHGANAPPLPEQIRQCQPRLRDFVLIARPRMIVTVGAVAKQWLDPLFKHGLKLPMRCRDCGEWMEPVKDLVKKPESSISWQCQSCTSDRAYRVQTVDVLHPAAVLRSPTAHKGLLVQKIVSTLRQAAEEYLTEEG